MFVKKIISVLRSMARAKSTAIKNKTDAMRARLVVFSLLRNKKLSWGAISDKIQSLLAGGQQHCDRRSSSNSHEYDAACSQNINHNDQSKAIVPYSATDDHQPLSTSSQAGLLLIHNSTDLESDRNCRYYYPDECVHHMHSVEDDKYPDLTHSFFDEEELDLGDPNASVINLVINSKGEGQNFSLEDEIDHVADLFIMKFHKNMRMQKLESFKRYQEMLERST